MSPEERVKRQSDDFNFMLLCASKGNMGMYELLRDRSLDPDPWELDIMAFVPPGLRTEVHPMTDEEVLHHAEFHSSANH